jgi:hypothetical protein
MKMKRGLFLLGALVTVCLTGCQNVKPWQRGTLADYTMRGDRDPLGVTLDEHIYFSREMASGGRAVGGGGCGCN